MWGKSGIYGFRHILSAKWYVGSTVNIGRRKADHLCGLRHKRHVCRKLQNAWNKYGEAEFEFVVLELVEDTRKLLLRESEWINRLNSVRKGYNIIAVPTMVDIEARRRNIKISSIGRRPTKETRAKMSLSHKARPPLSNETRQKIGKALTGRSLPPEQVEKMRSYWTPERRAAKSAAGWSEAFIAARAERLSLPRSIEERAKISAALMGHSVSAETLQKMSENRRHERCASGHLLAETRNQHNQCKICKAEYQRAYRAAGKGSGA